MSKDSNANIITFAKLLDERLQLIETNLRLLAAVCTRGGNPLNWNGADPMDITPNSTSVQPDTRSYSLALQERVAVCQRWGRFIESLAEKPAEAVVEPAKPHRLAAALSDTKPAKNDLALK